MNFGALKLGPGSSNYSCTHAHTHTHTHTKHTYMHSSGGSKGGSKFYNFMQFLGKFGKIVCWRPPPWELAPPPRGNHGSATALTWKPSVCANTWCGFGVSYRVRTPASLVFTVLPSTARDNCKIKHSQNKIQ